MKRLRSSSRTAATLAPNLENRIHSYTAAAAAAGVGLLALTQPSQAKVIYTPAHQTITKNSTFSLDLNADGVSDFAVSNLSADISFIRNTNGSPYTFALLRLYPGLRSNRVWGAGRFASALSRGVTVDSKGNFNNSAAAIMGEVSSNQLVVGRTYRGQWAPPGGSVTNKYVGLKFHIDGQVHYGWARFNVKIRPAETTGSQATLTGYAYETVPNKPIITGKTTGPDVETMPPVALGRLALGALRH
jgi:hypothetical protein